MTFLADIDFADFDAWWTTNIPSIFYEPTPMQNTLVHHDNEHLSIAGWRFNIRARIHRFANTKDVIDGWNLIDKNLKIVGKSIAQLYRPFFKIMLVDYNRIKSLSSQSLPDIPISKGELNLGIITLLQLAYWYKKCSIHPTFTVKEIELRRKFKEFTEFITSFDKDPGMEFKLSKLRDKLDDCVSELMFAGMTSFFLPNIVFDNKHDFLIKDIPCEVKTIHDKIRIAKDESGNRIVMTKKESFGQISLKAETTDQILRRKYWKDLRKAVSQGGKIIFVNASFSTIAHDLPMVDFSNDVDGDDKFTRLAKEAISYVSTNNRLNTLPVIVDVGIPAREKSTFRWYHTCYSFKAPVKYEIHSKISLDLDKYMRDATVNDLTLEEVLFNKYPFRNNEDWG
jgi:hypothetical protein